MPQKDPVDEQNRPDLLEQNRALRRQMASLQRRIDALLSIEWLLSDSGSLDLDSGEELGTDEQVYGNLACLNRRRVIADAVGPELLRDVAGDYLDLLGTSGAIYETNGDYALGVFTSGWCRLMDQASRALCSTDDNADALQSGKWLCHESCWECSQQSMDTGQPADIACHGGIRLYAVPIVADGEVVGSINVGYGDPPKDNATLATLADKYQLPLAVLREKSAQYRSRPPILIELAKKRLRTAAMLIGTMVAYKRAETRLEALTNELQQSNAELEEFAYAASHDLQEPLRAVSGYCTLLQHKFQGALGDDGIGYIKRAVDGTERMRILIHDLLDYARLGTDQEELRSFDLNVAFSDAVVRLRTVIEERGACVSAGALPSVMARRTQMVQLFQNLISNAIKYCTETTPKIHCTAHRGERDWTVAVRDNGIGIAAEYHERVFGVFQRLHSHADYSGTGIGLAMCKKIVECHGGKIWVTSAPGCGSSFYFTLPR